MSESMGLMLFFNNFQFYMAVHTMCMICLYLCWC